MGVPPFSRKLVCAVLVGISVLLCRVHHAEGITTHDSTEYTTQENTAPPAVAPPSDSGDLSDQISPIPLDASKYHLKVLMREQRDNIFGVSEKSFAAVVPARDSLQFYAANYLQSTFAKELRYKAVPSKGAVPKDQVDLSRYQQEILETVGEGQFRNWTGEKETNLGIDGSWVYRNSKKNCQGSILIHKLNMNRKPKGMKKNAFFISVPVEYPKDAESLYKYVEEIATRLMTVATLYNISAAADDKIEVLWVPLLGGSNKTLDKIRLATSIFEGLGKGATKLSPEVEFPCVKKSIAPFAEIINELRLNRHPFHVSINSKKCSHADVETKAPDFSTLTPSGPAQSFLQKKLLNIFMRRERFPVYADSGASFAAVVPGHTHYFFAMSKVVQTLVAMDLNYLPYENDVPPEQFALATYQWQLLEATNKNNALEKLDKEKLDKEKLKSAAAKIGIEKSWVYRVGTKDDRYMGSVIIHKLDTDGHRMPHNIKHEGGAFVIYVPVEYPEGPKKLQKYVADIVGRVMKVVTEHNETSKRNKIGHLWYVTDWYLPTT
eukprot:GHVU01162600.1.p1 GENE.GHVU01162600.1~~GHVU01162600.1.p1  ORF type:complete len:562 (-),score=61.79 GHVU01162600.1:507-2153(-)